MDVVDFTPEHSQLVYTFGGAAPVMRVRPGTVLELWSEDAFNHALTSVNDVASKVLDGGRVVVDGVHVKPGHPMLLAALPGTRWLVGLPGNPLAAGAALLTATDSAYWPVRLGPDGDATVLPSCGSARNVRRSKRCLRSARRGHTVMSLEKLVRC